MVGERGPHRQGAPRSRTGIRTRCPSILVRTPEGAAAPVADEPARRRQTDSDAVQYPRELVVVPWRSIRPVSPGKTRSPYVVSKNRKSELETLDVFSQAAHG